MTTERICVGANEPSQRIILVIDAPSIANDRESEEDECLATGRGERI